jgi:hypothetical protein
MDNMSILLIACSFLGAILVLIQAALMFGSHLNYPAFNAQIAKLCRAGNRERAIKLCNAVPRALYPAAVRAVLETAGTMQGETNLSLARARLQRVFEETFKKQRLRFARQRLLSLAALPLLIGSVLYPMMYDLPVPVAVYGGSGSGVLVLAWIASATGALNRAPKQFEEDLLPALLESLSD